MKKVTCCFILSCFVLSLFIIQKNVYATKDNENSLLKSTPLHIVLLMDASGSMKKTDPDGFRILASQAIISLLSSEDRIAIVEFSSDAKVISDWIAASERSTIFNLLNQIGNSGSFTDFRAGLETAIQLLEKTAPESNKVIFLLSDGVLDPNPYNEKYAPYHIQYRLAIRGKDKNEIRNINETYKGYLSPVAKRLIETNILPELKKNKIEVYCVGFSAEADRDFLNNLADETSKIKTESHYFYANHAIDLMETFLKLLHFWKNKIILKSEQGNIAAGFSNNIALDAYLRDISFITLTEKQADFYVKSATAPRAETILQGTHPNLKIAPVLEKTPPGTWSYGFNSGTGPYRLLAVGKSTLDLIITGIKEKYSYGEPIRANAEIRINDQDARRHLAKNPRVIAEITFGDSKEGPVDLHEMEDSFLFEHTVKVPGKVRIKFTLLARDKDGNDLLPRPSKEFVTEILPRFYVEPQNIRFWDLKQGKHKEALVTVHSGLEEDMRITVTSNIKSASRCGEMKEKLPFFKADEFHLPKGQTIQRSLFITAPPNGCWGDFEGDVVFSSDKGQKAIITYRVHIPSFWEMLTLFAIFVLIILILILSLLAYLWGYLKSPVGTLRPVNYPTGTLLINDIKLSRLKRGIWSKFLHWKKNVITIGQSGKDLKLSGLPKNMTAELIFHRFGGDYIRNTSPKESDHNLTVCNPDVGIDIERRPGTSYQLGHGLNIKIGDYEFIYEHIK